MIGCYGVALLHRPFATCNLCQCCRSVVPVIVAELLVMTWTWSQPRIEPLPNHTISLFQNQVVLSW